MNGGPEIDRDQLKFQKSWAFYLVLNCLGHFLGLRMQRKDKTTTDVDRIIKKATINIRIGNLDGMRSCGSFCPNQPDF